MSDLEGWVWAPNWNKAHYIRHSRSLCGKWLYPNKTPRNFEGGNDESQDNCTSCKRALQKEKAKEALEKLKEGQKIEFG